MESVLYANAEPEKASGPKTEAYLSRSSLTGLAGAGAKLAKPTDEFREAFRDGLPFAKKRH
jgi:hypothetical protein